MLLRADGHLTLTDAGASEALVEIARAPPDLILLDTLMPEIDGYQPICINFAPPKMLLPMQPLVDLKTLRFVG